MKLVRLATLVAAAAVSAPLALLGATPAQADNYTVPFKDPNAVGLIGFCDKDNKPMTSGNLRDVPFAFKAVSNVAAPRAYAAEGRKATLYAFSPIRNIDPGSWVSYQMTPSSFYSNPAHPMTAAGYSDPPLIWHVQGTPPTWDGLVQFRMYLSVPNQMPYVQPYPTAVVRVSGKTWTMVQGDRNPSCASGTSVNINQVTGKHEASSPPAWAANAVRATPSASKPPGQSASAGPTPSDTAGSSGATSAGADQATGDSAAGPTSSLAPIAVGAFGVLLVAALVGVVAVANRASRH